MEYELLDSDHEGLIPARRIQWEDGRWWDVLVEMPYGVQSKIRAAAAGAVVFVEGKMATSFEDWDPRRMMTAIEEGNQIRLLGCTVAWSFEQPVTEESILAMPRSYVDDVMKVLNTLHGETALGLDATQKKRSTSPSLTETPSLANGTQPETTSDTSRSV